MAVQATTEDERTAPYPQLEFRVGKTLGSGRSWWRAESGKTLAHPLEVLHVGPMRGQANDDAASAYDNFRRHFEEERAPRARLSLSQPDGSSIRTS